MIAPNHIAIIMDGNGRWGLKKFKSRLLGHKQGIENIKPIVNHCIKKNIKILTLYALSYDNFRNRNNREIKNLFNLFQNYIENNKFFFQEKKIKLNFFGEISLLPKNKKNLIIKLNKNTKKFQKFTINIAINYSSKIEILNAFKKLKKKQKPINEINFKKYLYLNKLADPEILVRTGNYSRLSDFLLWQCSYTELFFLKKLWPDFTPKDLEKIIKKFKNIKRNFGK